MFTLPELPYSYDALAPHISSDIMELHHKHHHQTYVDKLNEALEGAPDFADKSLEWLLTHLDELPDDIRTQVRNQGGGHYNHSQFWQWMRPDGGGAPTGELAEKLADKYGSFEKFTEVFGDSAAKVFGSGWVWLLPDLSIETSHNQDNPISDGKLAPILGLDVWEHAYYLDYTYKRPEYINAWWHVVNWDEVASRYTAS